MGYLYKNFTLTIIFLSLLFFTRFYNLETTARFIWDESSDLVRMHQYYVEKKLTLIGPITEDGSRIYSSLTYYMLMPFAIIGKFDPVSPVWGAAFFGTLTALFVIYLSLKLNIKLIKFILLLVLVWFPLIETSRWAWNPNLIPFWSTLGIIFFLRRTLFCSFLSGVFFGFTIHHHYLSLFTLASFTLVVSFIFFKQKAWPLFLTYLLGIAITLLPFIIFDLRHPPGLFLTRVLYANPIQTSTTLPQIFIKFLVWYKYMVFYYTQHTALAILLASLTPLLMLLDIKNKEKSIIFMVPWILHLVALIFIFNPGPIYYYYVLPSTLFFLTWIIYPRIGIYNTTLAKVILLILIAGGLISVIPKLTQRTWQTDIKTVRSITNIIEQKVKSDNLMNVNIAVLASPDNNIYGRRYRDLLLIKDVGLKTKYEYDLSDHLFVISSSNAATVRHDPAYEMHNFRRGPLQNSWSINNSEWNIYHFTR